MILICSFFSRDDEDDTDGLDSISGIPSRRFPSLAAHSLSFKEEARLFIARVCFISLPTSVDLVPDVKYNFLHQKVGFSPSRGILLRPVLSQRAKNRRKDSPSRKNTRKGGATGKSEICEFSNEFLDINTLLFFLFVCLSFYHHVALIRLRRSNYNFRY